MGLKKALRKKNKFVDLAAWLVDLGQRLRRACEIESWTIISTFSPTPSQKPSSVPALQDHDHHGLRSYS